MKKVLQTVVLLLGMLLWFLTCTWGYLYYEVIAIIITSILPFCILPIRNLILTKKVIVKKRFYYLILLILLIFSLYFIIQILRYNFLKKELDEYYRFYFIGFLGCYAFFLIFLILSCFFKKEKIKKTPSYNSFSHVLILFPSIMVLVSKIVFGDNYYTIFSIISALIFFVSFLGNMIKNRSIIRKEEYQKLYLILFLCSFFFENLIALWILPVLYFQLDEIGVI